MVPMATMFGRFAGAWAYAWGIVDVFATGGVWQIREQESSRPPERFDHIPDARTGTATVGAVEHERDAEPIDEWSDDEIADEQEPDPEPTLRVLVYSDDRLVRRQVSAALGRRPAPDLPALEYVECATEPMVIAEVDRGGFDLLILDGEATPAGGMGVCRQLKDEIYRCPPVLVIVGRPQDAWLATWSRADGVSGHPIDAIALADTVTALLRPRAAVANA